MAVAFPFAHAQTRMKATHPRPNFGSELSALQCPLPVQRLRLGISVALVTALYATWINPSI